jgi:integrase
MLTDAKVAAIKPPASGQEEHRDNKVTGLRLRVGAGGKKSWIVRARAGHKVVNKKLGSYPAMGLGAARKAAEKLLQAIARDGSTAAADRTFGELVHAWIENVAKPKNRSWHLQHRRLEMYVLPQWGERKLETIRRGDVRDLIGTISGEVTPNRVLTLIKTLFRYALSQDWLEVSPADAIEKPNAEKSRDRVLDMEELRRIYVAADLLGYPAAGFIKLLCLTGQRRTEVATMRWDDLDIENGTWTIPASSSKSGRTHLLPLPSPAIDLIRSAPRVGEFVWANDRGGPVKGYTAAKARLDGFLSAAGGTLTPWVFHDIRRSVATHMVRLGVSETTVGRVLNHAPQGITARVYALHSYAPEKRSALDRWAAEIMRAVEGRSADNVVTLKGGRE